MLLVLQSQLPNLLVPQEEPQATRGAPAQPLEATPTAEEPRFNVILDGDKKNKK